MLHDPRRDRKPSLPGFALFVASKPRDERYHWPECGQCAVGQYLASLDAIIPPLDKWNGSLFEMNILARGAANLCFVDPNVWTFGQLSDRILAHQRAETVQATKGLDAA
jgi:hypothetical protein